MLERDKRVLELINNLGICTRQQIQNIIFADVHENVCLRRLAMLNKREEIKRDYFNLGNNKNAYVYYLGNKPNKDTIRSDLVITDYIIKLMKEGYEIAESKRNTIAEDNTSNAIIKFKSKDKSKYVFLKLESEKGDFKSIYYKFKSESKEDVPNTLYLIDESLNVVKRIKYK